MSKVSTICFHDFSHREAMDSPFQLSEELCHQKVKHPVKFSAVPFVSP